MPDTGDVLDDTGEVPHDVPEEEMTDDAGDVMDKVVGKDVQEVTTTEKDMHEAGEVPDANDVVDAGNIGT